MIKTIFSLFVLTILATCIASSETKQYRSLNCHNGYSIYGDSRVVYTIDIDGLGTQDTFQSDDQRLRSFDIGWEEDRTCITEVGGLLAFSPIDMRVPFNSVFFFKGEGIDTFRIRTDGTALKNDIPYGISISYPSKVSPSVDVCFVELRCNLTASEARLISEMLPNVSIINLCFEVAPDSLRIILDAWKIEYCNNDFNDWIGNRANLVTSMNSNEVSHGLFLSKYPYLAPNCVESDVQKWSKYLALEAQESSLRYLDTWYLDDNDLKAGLIDHLPYLEGLHLHHYKADEPALSDALSKMVHLKTLLLEERDRYEFSPRTLPTAITSCNTLKALSLINGNYMDIHRLTGLGILNAPRTSLVSEKLIQREYRYLRVRFIGVEESSDLRYILPEIRSLNAEGIDLSNQYHSLPETIIEISVGYLFANKEIFSIINKCPFLKRMHVSRLDCVEDAKQYEHVDTDLEVVSIHSSNLEFASLIIFLAALQPTNGYKVIDLSYISESIVIQNISLLKSIKYVVCYMNGVAIGQEKIGNGDIKSIIIDGSNKEVANCTFELQRNITMSDENYLRFFHSILRIEWMATLH